MWRGFETVCQATTGAANGGSQAGRSDQRPVRVIELLRLPNIPTNLATPKTANINSQKAIIGTNSINTIFIHPKPEVAQIKNAKQKIRMSTPGMIFSSYIYRPVRVTEPPRLPLAP
jgi:hypothetical protein